MVIQLHLVILTWALVYPDLKGHSFKQKNSIKKPCNHKPLLKLNIFMQHIYILAT